MRMKLQGLEEGKKYAQVRLPKNLRQPCRVILFSHFSDETGCEVKQLTQSQ